MLKLPALSAEIFDYLRQRGVKPYVRFDAGARHQLADGVRLMILGAGERLVTQRPRLRLSVLDGEVDLLPDGTRHSATTTLDQVVLTGEVETHLITPTGATFLLADSEFLDSLSAWQALSDNARQAGERELADRLALVRHSQAFRRLPFEHVETALRRMSVRPIGAGETVFEKGDAGDAFYLIRDGHFAVWRTVGLFDETLEQVAELGPGDTFGDEALVTGGTRNATLRAVTAGELLRLGQADFHQLMSSPMIEEVPVSVAERMIATGWRIIDVRYAEEFEEGHIPGAEHLPLPTLRQEAPKRLASGDRLITVCLSGKRSAVAALLLRQRGFQVVSLHGGMGEWTGPSETGLPTPD